MDRLERISSGGTNSTLVAIKAALGDHQANIWTALPAIVQTFDATKLTVEAQPTIQAQVRQPGGKWVDTTIALCVDCPVLFPGGGGFTFTFPIAKDDEGLLVFSSRCIDAWHQQGGVQKQADLRMHDLSDGFFIPTGGLSLPKVVANVSANSAQLRSNDGNTVIELAAGNVVNIKGSVCNFNCPVVFNNVTTFLGGANGHIGGGGTVDFGNTVIKSTATAQIADVKTATVTSIDGHVHNIPTGESGPARDP
jgi:Phage protein Gp138 N-terminal domain